MTKYTKAQWRALNKLQICMDFWLSKKLKVYWVTLTSSPDSPADMNKSYQHLMTYIERKYGHRPEFLRIRTDEGFGVLHCFWAMTGEGMPNCQAWLSRTWGLLHNASNVWIRTIGGRGNDAARVARYAVSQYAVQGQGTHFLKATWSRFTHLPVKVRKFLDETSRLLRRECCPFQPWHVTFRKVMACAVDLMRGNVHTFETGHKIIIDFMTGMPIVFESPYDF